MVQDEPVKKKRGRPKGVPNKKSEAVGDYIRSFCDPFKKMHEIALSAEERGELQVAGQMYKELAQYCAPKRKAVEVKTAGEVLPQAIQVEIVGKESAKKNTGAKKAGRPPKKKPV